VDALTHMSASQNAKLVVMPADIPAAIRGIMSSLE
jgi:hypothetical protein